LLWQDAISQINDKILIGHGYDGYENLNPLYQSYEVRHERSKVLANAHTPFIPLVAHAHNDILEWICNYGLICFFICILPPFFYYLAGIFHSRSITAKLMFGVFLILLLMSLVDFPTRTPACLALTSICVGLSLGYASRFRVT